jgi:hypothetical protein
MMTSNTSQPIALWGTVVARVFPDGVPEVSGLALLGGRGRFVLLCAITFAPPVRPRTARQYILNRVLAVLAARPRTR